MMTPPKIEVVFTQAFFDDLKRLKKKHRHVVEDVDAFVERLRKGETPGDQIPGVGYTAYKVRLKSSDLTRGKRGGFRIIYYIQTATRHILLTNYVKPERVDISPGKVANLIRDFLSSA
jgi:mRNA-degrading endonuclease RelE of RelBE toxin-antitoxin system